MKSRILRVVRQYGPSVLAQCIIIAGVFVVEVEINPRNVSGLMLLVLGGACAGIALSVRSP